MSRATRYAAGILALAVLGACASSTITEPAPKCATTPSTSAPSCISADVTDPKI